MQGWIYQIGSIYFFPGNNSFPLDTSHGVVIAGRGECNRIPVGHATYFTTPSQLITFDGNITGNYIIILLYAYFYRSTDAICCIYAYSFPYTRNHIPNIGLFHKIFSNTGYVLSRHWWRSCRYWQGRKYCIPRERIFANFPCIPARHPCQRALRKLPVPVEFFQFFLRKRPFLRTVWPSYMVRVHNFLSEFTNRFPDKCRH